MVMGMCVCGAVCVYPTGLLGQPSLQPADGLGEEGGLVKDWLVPIPM